MSYQKYTRPNFGGQTQDNPGNYFGNGSLGDVTISANTSMVTANDDSAIYESHFKSLTVNSGVTLSLGFRRRAHVLYIQGDLNVQGSITMSTGASAQALNQIVVRRSPVNGFSTLTEGASSIATSYICPAAGAAGGSSGSATTGVAGTAGTNGQTGGGASGAANGGVPGSGTAGTAYSGGSGGGVDCRPVGSGHSSLGGGRVLSGHGGVDTHSRQDGR